MIQQTLVKKVNFLFIKKILDAPQFWAIFSWEKIILEGRCHFVFSKRIIPKDTNNEKSDWAMIVSLERTCNKVRGDLATVTVNIIGFLHYQDVNWLYTFLHSVIVWYMYIKDRVIFHFGEILFTPVKCNAWVSGGFLILNGSVDLLN